MQQQTRFDRSIYWSELCPVEDLGAQIDDRSFQRKELVFKPELVLAT